MSDDLDPPTPDVPLMVAAAKRRAIVSIPDDDGKLRTGRLVCWPTDRTRSKKAKVQLQSGVYVSVDPALVHLEVLP